MLAEDYCIIVYCNGIFYCCTDSKNENEGDTSHHAANNPGLDSGGDSCNAITSKAIPSTSHYHQSESVKEKGTPHSKQSLGAQLAQTYKQWKASHDLAQLSYICFTQPKTIYIQPLDDFPDFINRFQLHTQNLTLSFFDMLECFLQVYFSGMEVETLPSVSIHQREWKVRTRCHELTKQEQYCVSDLFPYLQSELPSGGHSIVGVVWKDLYPEDFNFVLGEASFLHKSAAISFGRYEVRGFDHATHQDITHVNGQVLWKLLRVMLDNFLSLTLKC